MNEGTWIIAHRGEHSSANENTLAAFEAAARAGSDMVEFDVRRLVDGTLIVYHGAEIAGQSLTTLTFHAFHELSLTAGVRVPTLAETLALCAGRIAVDIELKDPFCEDDLLRALFNARLRTDDYIVSSFESVIVKNLREAQPGIRTGLIANSGTFDQVAEELARVEADYLIPEASLLNEQDLAHSTSSGIPLLPWTINRRDELQRLLHVEAVAGLITDRPTLALRLRRISWSG
jgi:glycerophosphoryl diester phosphodiesterase